MRRTVLHSWNFWVVVTVAAFVLCLSAIQVAETRKRAAQRVGLDIEEEFARLHIVALVPRGPAANAGLAVGDKVLSVNGVGMAVIEDFDSAARLFERGQVAEVYVERDDQVRYVGVVPGMPAPWVRAVGRIAVGLLSLVIGIVALVSRSQDLRARLLAALFFLLAVEFTWPEGLVISSRWTMIGVVFFYVCTGAQLALELHLAAVLPRSEAWPRSRRFFIRAVYLAGLSIGIVGTLTYVVESHSSDFLPWSVYQVDELIHQVAFPAWAIGMLALLGYAAWRAPDRIGRLRATLVLLGVIPWSIYILAGWWSGYPDRVADGFWAAAMPLLVLCFPLSVFVAISRFQLFDLEIVVRRGLVYSTLTTILVALFYAALGAGGAIFSRVAGGGGRFSIGSFAVATLLLGLLFSPLRRGIQALIDRKFFPERDAMRRRLIELAGDLPAHGDSARMGEHLVQELCRIFRITSATLLFCDVDQGKLTRLAWSGPRYLRDIEPPMLDHDHPWVQGLRRAARPVDLDQLRSAEPEQGLTHWSHVPRLAVPLMVGKRLIAVLILGEKHRNTRYSREEIELLGLLAHHCAIAFDNARLARSATYEGLTGLLRREAVLDLLSREIARSRRYGRPLAIALADIDHFKRVNDRFGHLQGDRVLQLVARELSARVRASDAIGRYGGEEFLFVFPETTAAAGAALAEQLRKSVAEMQLKTEDGEPIEVRLSIGIAELPAPSGDDSGSVRLLLCSADRCLYRAKEKGRNRVESDVAPLPKPVLPSPA